jgi:hypothetical protein
MLARPKRFPSLFALVACALVGCTTLANESDVHRAQGDAGADSGVGDAGAGGSSGDDGSSETGGAGGRGGAAAGGGEGAAGRGGAGGTSDRVQTPCELDLSLIDACILS